MYMYVEYPEDGQTSCKVWLTSIEWRRCSNEGKTWSPLKFAGVPQTRQPISAASGPKFTILWEHMEEILYLTSFFSDCPFMPQLWRYSWHTCVMVHRWRFFASFLHPVFSVCRMQHISDMHKLTVRYYGRLLPTTALSTVLHCMYCWH